LTGRLSVDHVLCGLGHARASGETTVGREVRPGCLKVATYVESKRLADALADRLTDGDF